MKTKLLSPRNVTDGAELWNGSKSAKQKFDACIAAVAHKKFEGLDVVGLLKEKHVVFDVKCTLDRSIVDGRL